jgi:hypothetical protein
MQAIENKAKVEDCTAIPDFFLSRRWGEAPPQLCGYSFKIRLIPASLQAAPLLST